MKNCIFCGNSHVGDGDHCRPCYKIGQPFREQQGHIMETMVEMQKIADAAIFLLEQEWEEQAKENRTNG